MLAYTNCWIAMIDTKETGGLFLVADINIAKPPQTLIGASHATIRAGRAGHVGTAAPIAGSPDESKWAARLVGAGSL
jgi:hypothetical protein